MTALLAALTERLRPQAAHLEWLQVQRGRDVVLVAVEEVDVFQAADKYTLAITREGESIIRTPLKELEQQLDPVRFWRVHRNAIVRAGAVARVSRDGAGRLFVHLREHRDRRIAVSRAHSHRFRQM